jgi:hypothetical protein
MGPRRIRLSDWARRELAHARQLQDPVIREVATQRLERLEDRTWTGICRLLRVKVYVTSQLDSLLPGTQVQRDTIYLWGGFSSRGLEETALHELAHVLLARSHDKSHLHGDVWAMTLVLAELCGLQPV